MGLLIITEEFLTAARCFVTLVIVTRTCSKVDSVTDEGVVDDTKYIHKIKSTVYKSDDMVLYT